MSRTEAFTVESGPGFGGRLDWRVADLDRADWLCRLGDTELAEMEAVAARIAGHPVESLIPDAFDWPHTQALMHRVSATLRDGVGFCLLERMPVERWGTEVTRSMSWLLAGMLGTIVEQKFDGTRIYDVRDLKKPMGHGVRRSITNLEQEFHTDGGWLPQTPEIIALACLHQASRGGMSRVSSLATAHGDLQATHPDLLDLLYRPVWWDRQAEHGEGEPPCRREPMFYQAAGAIEARYYVDYVRKGHRLMGEALPGEIDTALDAFAQALNRPENCFDFFLEPGQIEFVNNRAIAHARTAFEDGDNRQPQGRHLVRLWMRRTPEPDLELPTAGVPG